MPKTSMQIHNMSNHQSRKGEGTVTLPTCLHLIFSVTSILIPSFVLYSWDIGTFFIPVISYLAFLTTLCDSYFLFLKHTQNCWIKFLQALL